MGVSRVESRLHFWRPAALGAMTTEFSPAELVEKLYSRRRRSPSRAAEAAPK